jgi:hypothetical protein
VSNTEVVLPKSQFFSVIRALSIQILRNRWRFPHNSFTCKGPGLKHDQGKTAKRELEPIHHALTKTVRRDYTQNKREIEARDFFDALARVGVADVHLSEEVFK